MIGKDNQQFQELRPTQFCPVILLGFKRYKPMKIAHRGLKVGGLGMLLCTLLIAEGAIAKIVTPQQSTVQQQIVQSSPSITDYAFSDGEWVIKIKRRGRDLIYDGLNTAAGQGIKITGGRKSGTKSRHVYTWRNKGTIYNVIWQPADPTFARVQVSNNGRVVLDKLLEAAPEN
jgi:hypothetical protein